MPWHPKFPEVYNACAAKCPPYPTADPEEGDEAQQARTLAAWRAHTYCMNACRKADTDKALRNGQMGGKKSKKNSGKKNRNTLRNRKN